MSPLKREIGIIATAGMVAGESIALGIFLTPAAMAKSLGSPVLLGAVWIAMALMAFAGAVCFGRLFTAMPESGGPYTYIRLLIGERTAFLYGWMNFAILDSGLTAALAIGGSAYRIALAPRLAAPHCRGRCHHPHPRHCQPRRRPRERAPPRHRDHPQVGRNRCPTCVRLRQPRRIGSELSNPCDAPPWVSRPDVSPSCIVHQRLLQLWRLVGRHQSLWRDPRSTQRTCPARSPSGYSQ